MRCTQLTLLLAVACLPAGCNLFGRGHRTAMLPQGGEQTTATPETSDPWIAAAAEEARPNLKRDQEPDPLGVRKWFVSSEARDIERNLGIE